MVGNPLRSVWLAGDLAGGPIVPAARGPTESPVTVG
jgi:hypothetical protein